MSYSKKRDFYICFIFLLSIFIPLTSFALIPQLDYPEVMGIDIDERIRADEMTLSLLGQYFYYFFVIIGGVVAFWGLLTGGFQWLTSGASPGKLSKAKNQVLASFLGIIVLLSSWVILQTLDPALITFPVLSISIPEPTSQEAGPLEHGYILYPSTPLDIDPIPVPGGMLQVGDTRRFPRRGGIVDLGGPTPQGLSFLDEIVFYNPVPYDVVCDRDANGNIIGNCCERDENGDPIANRCCEVFPPTEQIVAGTCDAYSYYYGVICFSEPNLEGGAMVVTSYNVTDPQSLVMPGPQYCRSLYSFKQPSPATSIYSRGDQVIFYEDDFPIDKNPETGEVIGGACLKIDADPRPERCRDPNNHLNILNQDYEAESGIFGIESLCGETVDEDGNVISRWYPLSMDLSVDRDRKYLIMLYQGGGGGDCPQNGAPFTGNAYKIDRKVQDFSDPKDPRLWWVKQGLEPYEPRSAQILPIEPIE